MTNTFCAYAGNRDEAIVAYLYEDMTFAERAAFESHVGSCSTCLDELAGLRGVRRDLVTWSPPVFQSAIANHQSAVSPQPSSSWRAVPVWAQAVAAVLVLGVAAGAANVNVHHDASGFTMRTGWMPPAAPAPAAVAAPVPEAQAPWRADLAKLESDMRAEQQSSARTVRAAMVVPQVSTRTPEGEAELLQQVKALIEQSEKREQSELALRIAQLARDTHVERTADLTKIDRMLGLMQNNTGFEVARQIQTLATRVSQTQTR